MTRLTLLPTSVDVNTSNRFKIEDATTTAATGNISKISDNSDSTYYIYPAGGPATVLRVGMADMEPDTGTRVVRFRGWLRMALLRNSFAIFRVRVLGDVVSETLVFGTGATASYYSEWINNPNPLGTHAFGPEWSDDYWGDIQLEVVSTTAFTIVTAFKGEYELSTAPIGIPVFPKNYQAEDNQLFVWDFNGSAYQMSAYRVRIFTEATFLDSGFDPDTSSIAMDRRGQGSATQRVMPLSAALTRGQRYFWTTQVTVKTPSGGWVSDWAYPVPFTFPYKPEVELTEPEGTITDTSRPTLKWDYDDPAQSLASDRVLYRLYRDDTEAWSGFDPGQPGVKGIASWTPLEEYEAPLAVNSGGEGSLRLMNPLEDGGSYRIVLWMRRPPLELGQDGMWSDPTQIDFDVDIPAPPAPEAFVVHPMNNRSRADLSMNLLLDSPPTSILQVERSLDGGETWSTFRGLAPSGVLLESTQAIAQTYGNDIRMVDLYPPFNKFIHYRARSISVHEGEEFAGPWAYAGVTIKNHRLWLKVPSDPSLDETFPVTDDWLSGTRSLPRSIQTPIGRTRPHVNRGLPGGDSFTVNFICLSQAQFDRLMALVQMDTKFLLQNEDKQWWVSVSGDVTWEDYLWDTRRGDSIEAHRVSVPVVEVSGP